MFQQKMIRGAVALQLVGTLAFSLFSPAIPVANADNNGTLKVHEKGTPSNTESNDPKVCVFNFEGFSFDKNQSGMIKIEPQGQDSDTTDSLLLPFGPTNNSGYAETSYINNGGSYTLANGHYKSTLYGKDRNGNYTIDLKAKSKVFKVVCGSIEGYKWNDANGDKKINGEQKLPGWTIFIDANNNHSLDNNELSKVTDANGEFTFTNLALGAHTICEVMQPNWVQTFPGTQSGCTSTTLTESSPTKNGKDFSFGNKKIDVQVLGSITLNKFVCAYNANPSVENCNKVNPASNESFDFTIGNTTKTINVFNNGAGSTAFNNLTLGTYNVCENAENAYTGVIAGQTQNDQAWCKSVELTNETPNTSVNFYNFIKATPVVLGSITIHKEFCAYVNFETLDENQNPECVALNNHGISEVNFSVRAGSLEYNSTATIKSFDGNTGKVNVANLLPGDYQVCETEVGGFKTIATPGIDQRIDGCVYISVDGDENDVYFQNFSTEKPEIPSGQFEIVKLFCSTVPNINLIFGENITTLDSEEVEANPFQSIFDTAGCGKVPTTAITFKVYKGEEASGDPVKTVAMNTFEEEFGSGSAEVTVPEQGVYTVCEVVPNNYEARHFQPIFLRTLDINDELWFPQGNCVTINTEDAELTSTALFLNLYKAPTQPEQPVTPTPTPMVTPTPEQGQVLGEQVKQEKGNVLAAVTQLPSTGVGSELGLIGALFLGALFTRRRIG